MWSPALMETIHEAPAAGMSQRTISEKTLMPLERGDGKGTLLKKNSRYGITRGYVERPDRKSVAGKPANKIEGTLGDRISSKGRLKHSLSTPEFRCAGVRSSQLDSRVPNTVLDIPSIKRIGEKHPGDADAAGRGQQGDQSPRCMKMQRPMSTRKTQMHGGVVGGYLDSFASSCMDGDLQEDQSRKFMKAPRPMSARKTQMLGGTFDPVTSNMDGVAHNDQPARLMRKARPMSSRKTQLHAGCLDAVMETPRYTTGCESKSSVASTSSRTTASSKHQRSLRYMSPRHSHDGGSSAGFSYASVSSRSERRLRASAASSASSIDSRSSYAEPLTERRGRMWDFFGGQSPRAQDLSLTDASR